MCTAAASARRFVWAAVLAAVVAGCTQTPKLEYIEGPKLRVLEAAYDREKWRWVRNSDGRALLVHTQLSRCFVDPEPPLDVHDPGFTLKRAQRQIAGTRYEVVSIFEKSDFWEAVYTRAGAKEPILSVYARGACQEEAERILQRYEESFTTAGKATRSKAGEQR